MGMRINSPQKCAKINICFAFLFKRKKKIFADFGSPTYRRIAFCRNRRKLKNKFQIIEIL